MGSIEAKSGSTYVKHTISCLLYSKVFLCRVFAGNKGAVGISFFLGSTSFCFINCHLAARNERVLR